MTGYLAVLPAGVSALSFAAGFVFLDGRSAPARASPPAWDALVSRVASLAPLVRGAAVERRRGECLAAMPQMLDIVTLGLHAGLSFDSSLELYCAHAQGELAKSLFGALVSWRTGACSRSEALGGLSDELGVAALRRFSDVVLQALEFGSPLAETLELQAQAIRDEQRSQVEEAIERVPVRMLIPMGALIVPAMLLAILGPLLGSAVTLG